MALKPPPPPWEVLQQIGESLSKKGVGRADTGGGLRDEIDRGARALAQSALRRMDVVSREEFDAQAEILRRTRAKVTALEAELEDISRMVEQPDDDA